MRSPIEGAKSIVELSEELNKKYNELSLMNNPSVKISISTDAGIICSTKVTLSSSEKEYLDCKKAQMEAQIKFIKEKINEIWNMPISQP